jgi:hypothetical protein
MGEFNTCHFNSKYILQLWTLKWNENPSVQYISKSALCENQYYLQSSSSPLLIFINLTKPLLFTKNIPWHYDILLQHYFTQKTI